MIDQPSPSLAAPLRVLAYGHAEPREPGRGGSLPFLLLILPALVTPFINFTFGVSPLDVWVHLASEYRIFPDGVAWILLSLAAPFFTAFPLVVWKCMQLSSSRVGRGSRIAMWVVSILCSLPVIIAAIRALLTIMEDGDYKDMWPFPVGLGLLALYWVAAGILARHRQSEHAITLSFYAGYLGNAAYCLGAFYGSTGTGYYFTIYVAAIMLADTGRMLYAASRRS